MEIVVSVQLEALHDGESLLGIARLGDCRRPVELDHR